MKALICLLLIVTTVCDEYDDTFLACCKAQGLSTKCQKMCNYQVDAESIIGVLYDSYSCGVKDGPVYYQCLQNMTNNRDCCERNSVGNYFDFCLDLCDGSAPIALEMKYFNCKEDSGIVACGQKPWI